MCGSLQLTATEKLSVYGDTPIKRTFLTPSPKMDLSFSYNHFIRREKSTWWKNNTTIAKTVLLKAKGFYERGVYFNIPEGYQIKCVVHRDIVSNKWVISILTIDSHLENIDPILEELRAKIVPIHHRIPVLEKAA